MFLYTNFFAMLLAFLSYGFCLICLAMLLSNLLSYAKTACKFSCGTVTYFNKFCSGYWFYYHCCKLHCKFDFCKRFICSINLLGHSSSLGSNLCKCKFTSTFFFIHLFSFIHHFILQRFSQIFFQKLVCNFVKLVFFFN